MNGQTFKILAVDDEPTSLDILKSDLEDVGYEVICAEDGRIALDKLKEHPEVDVIVLDRMMPNMDGIELTKELKASPLYRNIPIVMQTAAGQSHQVREGLQVGVYYYLIKPYELDLLLGIIRNALNESSTRKEAMKYASSTTRMVGLMKEASFHFRTLQDVRNLAFYIASCCPRPDAIVYGLNELMTNAVEHGNLAISYQDKLDLVMENRWQQEVDRRLSLEENKDKFATLIFASDEKSIFITIKDRGKGFNWQSYLNFDPMRLSSDPHGKGIAITKVTSFPNMEYRAGGSEVVCRIDL